MFRGEFWDLFEYNLSYNYNLFSKKKDKLEKSSKGLRNNNLNDITQGKRREN